MITNGEDGGGDETNTYGGETYGGDTYGGETDGGDTINLKTYTTEELEDLFYAVQEELQAREEEEEQAQANTTDAIIFDEADDEEDDDQEEQDVFDEDDDVDNNNNGAGGDIVAADADDDDPEEDDVELEDIRVTLKPRCNVLGSVKQFRYNEKIGSVELDVYKNWLRDADEEHVWALFDALGQHPTLQKLTFRSRGSSTQSLPVSHLTHLLGEAMDLREFRSEHVKWKGDPDDFELLAATLGEHTGLRALILHVESVDVFEGTLSAAGKIPTLQAVEIQSALQAENKAGLTTALQSLCNSPSLRSMKLIHVTHKFEILSHMARLLCSNTTLQELFIQATELDLNGGMAMAQMLTANQGLSSFILKLDKMHGKKLAEAFIQALDMNYTLQYFQIMLDGRTCDIKSVRAMQMEFRKLKPKYKVSSQVGLSMGVTVEPLDEDSTRS